MYQTHPAYSAFWIIFILAKFESVWSISSPFPPSQYLVNWTSYLSQKAPEPIFLLLLLPQVSFQGCLARVWQNYHRSLGAPQTSHIPETYQYGCSEKYDRNTEQTHHFRESTIGIHHRAPWQASILFSSKNCSFTGRLLSCWSRSKQPSQTRSSWMSAWRCGDADHLLLYLRKKGVMGKKLPKMQKKT